MQIKYRAKVLAEVLTIQDDDLFAKCDFEIKDDENGHSYSDYAYIHFDNENETIFDQERLINGPCTGLYLLKGKALFESGQIESAKEYLCRSSCRGKKYIAKNKIGLTEWQAGYVRKTCRLEEIQDAQTMNQIEQDEKRRVQREFKEKLDENYYQFQKDYIRRN